MELDQSAAIGGHHRSGYMYKVHQFPMLSAEAEQELCRRWRDHCDISAAHLLVNSHLRLVVKIVVGFRGYGLPSEELIAEGNVGLMRAISRFDPDRGVRFSSYATWWVRASIQMYILHNWSMVKMGTTAAQRKLFFNLRRMNRQLNGLNDGKPQSDHIRTIAAQLRVPERDVMSMSQRLAGPDRSLNAPIVAGIQDEWQSHLVDSADNQETVLAEREEEAYRRSLIPAALGNLTVRERHIVAERHLRETPATQQDLSRLYGISDKRVGQIEAKAISKLQQAVLTVAA